MRDVYGLPCLVAINHFTPDTEAEIELRLMKIAHQDVKVVVARHWAEGGKGAEELARKSSRLMDRGPERLPVRLRRADTLWDKMGRSRRRSTVPRKSRPTARCARRSSSCRTRATVTIRSASRRRSTRSRPIRAARRASGHVVNIREVRLRPARSSS